MHHRIRFYSDDSYYSCGKRLVHAVVAGVAIQADRTNVNTQLVEAERVSKKGLSDWSHTTPSSIRWRYLEAVLEIESLNGRVFFMAFDALGPREKREARVITLRAAIKEFTPGRCHHAMHHEGLTHGPRRQLRIDLQNRGCEGVTVEAAQFATDPEVRLADALAGYIRAELYRNDGTRAELTNLPDRFVDLGKRQKNETPRGEPGGEASQDNKYFEVL